MSYAYGSLPGEGKGMGADGAEVAEAIAEDWDRRSLLGGEAAALVERRDRAKPVTTR
jgi:hypothetical protein